jgi:hypothetical protein
MCGRRALPCFKLLLFGLSLQGGFSTAAQAAAPPVAPAEALPWELAAGSGSGVLEGMFAVADLRHLDRQMGRFAAALQQTPAGQALFGSPGGEPTDLPALLDLAAPQGQAVPAAVLLVGNPAGVDLRLAIAVQPEFLSRCAADQNGAYRVRQRPAAAPSPGVAGMSGVAAKDETRLDFVPRNRGTTYYGQLFASGMLVLTSTPELLPKMPAAARDDFPSPSPSMRQALAGSQSALWLRGGELWRRGLAELAPGGLQDSLGDLDGVALALRADDDRSVALRLLVEAPWATALRRALLPRATAPDGLLADAGADCLAYVSLLSTDLLRAAGKAYLAAAQRRGLLPDAPLWSRHVDKLAGRLGALRFAAPDDWAVVWELETAAAASAMLADMQGLATALLPRLSPGAMAQLEQPSAASGPLGAVLHLRPDPAVEGFVATAAGNRLWLSPNLGRLRRLAAAPAATAASSTPEGLLQGPLTPLVRQVLQADSLLQGYAVLGGDGGWLGNAQWLGSGLPLAGPLGPTLPKLLDVFADIYRQTYDLAWSAGVTGDLLELTLAASEL